MSKPIEFHPAILYSGETKAVHDALVAAGHNELATMIARKSQRSKTDHQFITALSNLDEDNLDVDDMPIVATSEDGAHVMVWRWVTNEQAGISSDK